MELKPIFLSLCFVLLVVPSAVRAQGRVTAVRVDGNDRIEDETVLLQTALREGSEFTSEKLSNDIKQIYRMGYFDQVLARTERSGDRVLVIFEVVEKPAIRSVFLEGNDEVNDDTLKEKLNLGARRFLDRSKIRASIEQATLYYQGLGYYDAKISVSETALEGNEVDLTFKVEEGKKKRVQEIVFEGNKSFDSDELEDVVKTGTHFWLTSWITGSGVLKQEQLSNDSKDLMRFYLTKGHIDVRVPEPEITEIEDGLRVTYKISEGDVYAIGAVSATGSLVDNSAEATLEGIETKSGEIFNAEAVRNDTFKISEKFTDKGYAFTNVNPETEVNREAKTVDIRFEIDKGNLVDVDRINITGNQKTADNVIRRSLKIQEQETYSSSKIRRSQELLQRLGYFDEVTITSEPSALQDHVDLNVAVREANTGSFSIGAGVSSGEGFIFQSQISENNIFGTGNSVTFDVNTGSERQNFILSFDNPRVNDTYLSFGVDALSLEREYDDFTNNQVGGGMSIGYPLWFLGSDYLEDVRGTVNYQLVEVDINDIELDAAQFIKDSEGKSTASSITPKLVRNTINNPLDPTKGSRQLLSVEVAGLGGDEEFWLANASNTFYYNFWDSPIGPLVFANRIKFGYGENFNDEPFPLYKRFFPGGINSVRGYESREMGPQENGSRYGGSSELVANFELIFPVVESIGLKGVVFFDAGNAFDDEQNIEISELRKAVGWGFRWRSPIAPIRIEIGYPLDKEPGDKSVVTNFTFGSPM